MEKTLIEEIAILSREQIIQALTEFAGIQCYDSESDDILREALRVNVLDGTIPWHIISNPCH